MGGQAAGRPGGWAGGRADRRADGRAGGRAGGQMHMASDGRRQGGLRGAGGLYLVISDTAAVVDLAE